jgi:hypothetical protein
MDAQRVRAPKPGKNLLQKALGPEVTDGIRYRRCLPLEDPACHRKANRRVTKIHHSHDTPRSGCFPSPSGEELHKSYRHNINRLEVEQGTTVPST